MLRSDRLQPIVDALRQVIQREAPDARESVLWGGLSFHRPRVGGRVKGAVCQIGTKGGRVRLDFIHGVRLRDPHGLLEGDLRSKRFVYVDSVSEARQSGLAGLIREAAALDPSHWA